MTDRERLEELMYNVGRSLNDDEHVLIKFDGIFLSNYQIKVDEDGGEIARKALEGKENE